MTKPYEVVGVNFVGQGGTAILRGLWDPVHLILDIDDAPLIGDIRRARGGSKEAVLKVGKQTFQVLSAKPMSPASAHLARIFVAEMPAKSAGAPPASNAVPKDQGNLAASESRALNALDRLNEAACKFK